MDCKMKQNANELAMLMNQSNLFVQEKRLTGGPAKIMSKNVWSRKMCIYV